MHASVRKSLILSLLALTAFAGAAFASPAEDAPAETVWISAAALDPGASVMEVIEIEAQAECSGDLGAYSDPACMPCNGLQFTCQSACSSHGGVQHFECVHQEGVECICNDGAYDSCTCSAIIP